MSLFALSTELLLCIASSLQRPDLLNLSLTCKLLRSASEPELFRDYSNVSQHGCSFLPFLKRIICQPNLGKHVRKLHLRSWTTLGMFPGKKSSSNSILRESHRQRDSGSICGTQLSPADCSLLVQAARDTGVIQAVAPVDSSTCEPEVVHVNTCTTAVPTLLRGPYPFDRMFCERLRAGCEDPLVVLLIALLPNVRDIVLDGVPRDLHALIWWPKHGFPALRTLTACAIEGELQWPFTFLQPLLALGKLRILKASHAASARLQLTTRELTTPELPLLALSSGTLTLERVELENCCLGESDLQSLLRSCTGLKSFLYTSRKCEVGPWSPSPAAFVELLRPHQTTLHSLILDVEAQRYDDKTDNKLALIHSLAHMTALKVLVTAPEMWHSVTGDDDEFDVEVAGSVEGRLSTRVPPNLHTLVFGMSAAEKMTSPSQLGDLVRMRKFMLPNLINLSVGGIDSVYVQEVKQLYLDLDPFTSAGPHELHAEIGPIYVRSVFDIGQLSHIRNEVRWAERRYVTSPMETSLFARGYERIRRELPC
jgi:hypothetical protein